MRRDDARPTAVGSPVSTTSSSTAALLLLGLILLGDPVHADPGLVIRGATVVDGSGAPGVVLDVRIEGEHIVAVGPAAVPGDGDRIIEASGLVLAPGFIDTHSHHDIGLFEQPDATAAVSQGITTIVVGQDGGAHHPLRRFFHRLDRQPAAVNVASFAGHGALRNGVLGDDTARPATAAEIEAMAAVLDREMRAGALGLSTGLEYDPGIHADVDELVALAKVAASHGGRYVSHMRSEDRDLFDAARELVTIGQRAEIPVHASHLKLAMRSLWGEAPALLEIFDRARASGVEVSADVYPYDFWQSTITVLFPNRDFDNRTTAAFALDELVPPDGFVLSAWAPDPSLVGQSLAQIALDRQQDPVDVYLGLLAEAAAWKARTGQRGESMLGRSMDEDDIATLYRWPHTNVSSDGALADRHPRGAGSFPRVLGRFAREKGELTLEQAIHKSTALAATHVGLATGAGGRGLVTEGAFADLVLFDPATVVDRATSDDPSATSAGIVRVWVAGRTVWDRGATTGARPGKALRRPGVVDPHDPAVLARLDDAVRDAGFGGTGGPGCAMAVTGPDGPPLLRGWGMANLDGATAITPASVFRSGSVSKQFTAAVVALLHLRGALRLDEPVRTYLPELPRYDEEDVEPLTVRHLVHHTSGVRDYLALMSLAGLRNDDFYTDAEALAMIVRQRALNFAPGGDWLYSNAGYFLLSQIVLRATGQSLREAADALLFTPLGMRHTHFHDDHDEITAQRAVGYTPADGAGWRRDVTELDMVGDGGVFTSAEDLARWLDELHRGSTRPEDSVLGDEFHTLVRSRGTVRGEAGEPTDTRYAFGLFHSSYRGLPTLGHGGAFVGYRAGVSTFPEQGLGIGLLCNSASASPGRLALRLADVLLEGRLGDPAPPRQRPPEVLGPDGDDDAMGDPDAIVWSRWVGRWYLPELDVTYRIERVGEALRITAPPGLDLHLRPSTEDGATLWVDGNLRLRAEPGDEDVLRFDAGRVRNLRLERAGDG